MVLIYNRKRIRHTRRRSNLTSSGSRAGKTSFNASKSSNETQTTQPFVTPPTLAEKSVCASKFNDAGINPADRNESEVTLLPAGSGPSTA